MKITEHAVTTAPRPPAGRTQTFYFDQKLTGFGLCVAASGRRSFVAQARVRRTNHVRRVVLGQWPAMTVEQARTAARPLLLGWAAGHDRQQDQKPAITLGAFIPRYLEYARAHKRSHHKDEVELVRYLPSEWRTRPLDSFTTGEMVGLHVALGARGHYVANGFLRLLRAMLNRARDWGYLPETAPNATRKVQWFPEPPRERFLTLHEYDRLQQALDAESDQLWSDYFRLCLLTAQRRSEVAGMRWTELDLEAAVWTLPPERTKAKRLTRIPLTSQAIDILKGRSAASPFVFPSPRKAGAPIVEPKGAWSRVKAAAGIPDDVRLHDLRRTAASFAIADGTSLAVIGKLLNHSRPETTQIYARLDLGPVRAALQATQDRLDARRNGALHLASEPDAS